MVFIHVDNDFSEKIEKNKVWEFRDNLKQDNLVFREKLSSRCNKNFLGSNSPGNKKSLLDGELERMALRFRNCATQLSSGFYFCRYVKLTAGTFAAELDNNAATRLADDWRLIKPYHLLFGASKRTSPDDAIASLGFT